MSNDLQQIVTQIFQNPNVLKTGTKVGQYSVALGKIWRGNLVIGYVAPSTIEGEKPSLMHTSQTTSEEAQIMQAPAPEAAEEAPVMGINSPEGEQAEAPETGPAPGDNPKVSPTGDVSQSRENGDESENPPPPGKPKPKNRAQYPAEALDITPSIIYPDDYELLNESRLEETRRKYIKCHALVEFDIETKRITGGEWIHVYLLPANRAEGKKEIYDFCVTKTAGIPSSFTIAKEVIAAVREHLPHTVINQHQLIGLGRRMHKIMRAAKDAAGGPDVGESLKSEIELYLAE